MNEIEKMYKNAGFIKKQCKDYSCIVCDKNNNCEKYPLFTAEKQIELIKWLALRDCITIVAYMGGIYSSEHDKYNVSECSLESCLARLINNLWQGLTEKEKQQIKDILK